MIPLLVQRISNGLAIPPEDAALLVLTSDPFDIVLHMEQLWHLSKPWGAPPAAGPAKQALFGTGAFAAYAPAFLP